MAVAETLTPSGATGAYLVPNVEWTAYSVYTNKMSVGPYRGYGQHATAYAGGAGNGRHRGPVSLGPGWKYGAAT